MDAFIGLTGIGLVILGVPISLFILIFKKVKKTDTKKDKTRPLLFLAVGFVLFCIALLITPESNEENSDISNENITTEQQTETTSEEEKVTTEETEKTETSFEYADMIVDFLEYKIEEDAAGTQCLVLYFDFTNNANDSYAFGYTFAVKAFQDGVELEPTYFHVNDETKNSEKEIKKGVTLTVAEQFELAEVSGDIEIEIEPFNIWSDKNLFTYEFNLD
jgi:hypothetical protein